MWFTVVAILEYEIKDFCLTTLCFVPLRNVNCALPVSNWFGKSRVLLYSAIYLCIFHLHALDIKVNETLLSSYQCPGKAIAHCQRSLSYACWSATSCKYPFSLILTWSLWFAWGGEDIFVFMFRFCSTCMINI